jgi:ABC-type amino acid transport substrate-binding protein
MDTTNNNTDPKAATPESTSAGTPPPAANPLSSTPTVAKPDFSQNAAASAGIPQSGTPAGSDPSKPGTTTPPVKPHKSSPMLWVIILLVFSFFCGLFIAAWYFQTQLQKVTPEQTTQNPSPSATPKKLVIGTDATFPPMEYTASGEATLIGYDIDLGNKIASEMGTTVEFKNIPWDDLFTALDNKGVDMIMSSVTITEDRKQKYDFSENYLNAGQVIITRKEDTTITSAETLKGKRIAIQEGTTNEQEALKHTTANLVIRYPDYQQATQALVDGKADALLSDLPAAKGIITANPTLKISSDPFTNEYYGIVFRKGDPQVKIVNEVLSSLRTKGILTDLKQKWLD